MKVLLFCGNHPRHLFMHSAILNAFDVTGAVCMRREEILPTAPEGTSAHDVENFNRHFKDRYDAEQKYFGDLKTETTFAKIPTHYCTKETLNTAEVAQFVQAHAPDVVFIFGVRLLKDPVLSILPKDRINIHLGLSPWYRGAATLFWPFYNMQPQYAGSTLHKIVPEADAGAVIHQSVPQLERGDKIHDVACKTVIQSSKDIVTLFKEREETGVFQETAQRSSGRLYLEKDFRPEHLRVVYDLFNNDMVDEYLNQRLVQETPQIVRGIHS